ncbi:unnamed protein product [Arctogadus glacialis]
MHWTLMISWRISHGTEPGKMHFIGLRYPPTNQGPVSMGDLKAEPISEAVMNSSLQTDQSHSPPPMESTPKSHGNT